MKMKRSLDTNPNGDKRNPRTSIDLFFTDLTVRRKTIWCL